MKNLPIKPLMEPEEIFQYCQEIQEIYKQNLEGETAPIHQPKPWILGRFQSDSCKSRFGLGGGHLQEDK